MQSCKQKSRTHATAWTTLGRPRGSAEHPAARSPRLERELQVVNFAKLVVHLEERLDDRLDLVGHPVELVEGHPLELASHLLVEVEQGPETPGREKPPVDLI